MNLGPSSRLLSTVAAVFLIATGLPELAAQSQGAESWGSENSFIALGLRAQGSLKIGLGLGFLALATAGVVSTKDKEDPDA